MSSDRSKPYGPVSRAYHNARVKQITDRLTKAEGERNAILERLVHYWRNELNVAESPAALVDAVAEALVTARSDFDRERARAERAEAECAGLRSILSACSSPRS